MMVSTVQHFSRKAMGQLWEVRNKFDAGVVSQLQTIYNNKTKGKLIGEQTSVYKLSKSKAGQLGFGRLYGTKGSFEYLQNEIRATLCKDLYHDIDIVNAQPVLLAQLAKNKFDKDLPHLERYIDNREKFLREISSNRDEAKQEVIRVLYGGKPKHDILMNLYEEIRTFAKQINQTENYSKLWESVQKEDNKYGAFLALVAQTEERECMLALKRAFEERGWVVGALIYDGIMVERREEVGIDQELMNFVQQRIREQTGYSVSVLEKEMIGFSDLPEVSTEEEFINGVKMSDFVAMREEFERNHFFLMETQTICEVGSDKKITMYKPDNAKVAFGDKWGFDIKDNKNIERVNFITLWLKTPGRRTYNKLVFNPQVDLVKEDEYNLYNGLIAEKIEAEPNEEGCDRFLEIIKNLVSGNEVLGRYVIGWFAHLIQKPQERPGTALIFSGPQGIGKDTVMDFLGNKVLGHSTYYSTSDAERDIFGKHSHALEGTFLIKLEEASGHLNRNEANKLKSLITKEKALIEPKGLKTYEVDVYARIAMTTNESVPVKMEMGDRRFCICYCGNNNKGNFAYWKETHELFADPGTAKAVYNFLKEFDLTDFNVRDIPRDEGVLGLMEAEKPYELMFLESIAARETQDTYETSAEELYEDYRIFCEKNHRPPYNKIHFGRTLAPFISRNQINRKKTKICYMYIIHLQNFRT